MQIFNVSYSTLVSSSLGVLPSYYIENSSGSYQIFLACEEFLAQTSLDAEFDAVQIADFNASFKSSCTLVDSADDACVLGVTANKIPFVRNRNSDGITTTSVEPRLGSELILVTHNFCDKTTWFSTSERVNYETLNQVNGTIFQSANSFWVDLTHGKMYDEDAYRTEIDHGYEVVVVVNGVTASMREPLSDSGGDYQVDYRSGSIQFFTDQSGKTVEACYSKVVDSMFTVMPEEGKFVDIECVEAQFSEDVILRDTIEFQIWGYNPYDLPNKVQYVTTNYKSMRNFIDEALGSYPVIPAIGGPEGRGIQNAVYGFPFRYGTIRRLESSSGIELRVKLRDDKEFGGEIATATFYCTVRSSS